MLDACAGPLCRECRVACKSTASGFALPFQRQRQRPRLRIVASSWHTSTQLPSSPISKGKNAKIQSQHAHRSIGWIIKGIDPRPTTVGSTPRKRPGSIGNRYMHKKAKKGLCEWASRSKTPKPELTPKKASLLQWLSTSSLVCLTVGEVFLSSNLSLCIHLSASLPVGLSPCLSVCLFLCLSVCLSVSSHAYFNSNPMSVCPSVSLCANTHTDRYPHQYTSHTRATSAHAT